MSLKLRYWTRLLKAFVLRFKLVLFAGVIFGLLLFSLLRFFAPYLFNMNVEIVGRSGRYHAEELPQDILNMIGEGLTKVDETGEPKPALAKSWQSEDDGKKWIFYLDESKYWHDGTKVLSKDINYNFDDATITRPDEKTIIFELSAPFSPFPVVVSRPVFKRGFLGTGEWKVYNIKLNSEFVERISLINKDDARRIIKFYPTEETLKIAFQLGEIDIIVDLLDPYPFSSWKNVSVYKNVSENRFAAVFFNNESDPFKENKQLKQALSYAVDKNSFNSPRALGPIAPKSWAYNPQVKEYDYSVERAKEILKDMPNEVIENSGFTLTTTPVLLTTAERLAAFWNDIGIKVEISVVSVIPEDYQAFLAIYNSPQDPDQYSIWHTTQTQTNISKFSNPRIDLLLEEGRLELDKQERKRIYLDFQRYLLEEAPAIFLYHPISYNIVRK